MALTDIAIKSFKPEEKRYKKFDGQGLYIEVQPSGSKVWRIRYSLNKKEKRYTIGHYPHISLRDARAVLAKVLEKLSLGQDPFGEEKVFSPIGETFFEVAEDWVEKQSPRWSIKYKSTLHRRLEMFVYPHIGQRRIAELAPPEVLHFIRLIEAQGKHETATRVLGICSQVFRYGVACGVCPSDPCRDLQGALTAYVEVPFAALTEPNDVSGLMRSIEEYKGSLVTKSALLWSAYTFCRPGEVRRAEWGEIDWKGCEWRIPAEKMKMRFEHRVPLAHQCMELLKNLKKQKYSDKWIFPGPRPSRPLSENGVLSAIRRMGYEKHEMTAHGFRAMASTLLNELGYRSDIIERQLAHGEANKVRAVYNRALYMDERRIMMQEWADYLDNLARMGMK